MALGQGRFSHLLYLASLNLGAGTTADDAEEVTQEFLYGSLENVVRCFRASDGSFWSYFRTAFQHECWRQAKRIRERIQAPLFGDEQELPLHQLRPVSVDALELVELRASLELALGELDERSAAALKLHHMEGMSVSDVAVAIDVSLSNAKVLLHRARHDAAELMRWEMCSRLTTERSATGPASVKLSSHHAVKHPWPARFGRS